MINKENLKKLVKEYESLNKAAEDIGISAAGLSRIINGKRDGGKKTIQALGAYCKRKNLKLDDYIFFS